MNNRKFCIYNTFNSNTTACWNWQGFSLKIMKGHYEGMPFKRCLGVTFWLAIVIFWNSNAPTYYIYFCPPLYHTSSLCPNATNFYWTIMLFAVDVKMLIELLLLLLLLHCSSYHGYCYYIINIVISFLLFFFFLSTWIFMVILLVYLSMCYCYHVNASWFWLCTCMSVPFPSSSMGVWNGFAYISLDFTPLWILKRERDMNWQ